MTQVRLRTVVLFVTLLCGGSPACTLKRPDVIPARMIEPRLVEPPSPPASATPSPTAAASIRILDTQARGHIGRRLLHQESGGELVEDSVWRWSSAPDRYLDSALRLAAAARPDVHLVDSATAPALAVTLVAWHLESTAGTQLVGAVEVGITRGDRTVRTEIIRATEPVLGELPGDLAVAAGRLLHTLASESVKRAAAAATTPR